MKNRKTLLARTILAVASLILTSKVWAEPTFDPMFGDHMVLQRGMPVPIWGTADSGEKVTVSFRDQKKETTADQEGKWKVKLDPLKVGAAGKLTVAGKTTRVLSDVLVGDVWLGSGQSNMSWRVGKFVAGDEALAAMVKAGPYPNLRLYQGDWKIAAADDIGNFSALMFSFGLPLQKELDVPVGLIVGAVSGTASGRWLSPEMLLDDPGLKKTLESNEPGKTLLKEIKAHPQALANWEEAAKQAAADGKPVPEKPALPSHLGDLYAQFIEPVVPYAIRGVVWDQGEGGTRIKGVSHQFPVMHALIQGWRKAWGQGDFPFLCVQKPSGGGCAWDAQGNPLTRMASKFVPQPTEPNDPRNGKWRCNQIQLIDLPKTALVITSDLGSGIHPPDKSSYGRRSYDIALSYVYGGNSPIYGPRYDSHVVEGKQIRVRFKHVGKGLVIRHSAKLQGFEIAGKDHPWHWAEAKIEGDTVVVSSQKVPHPVHIRYKSHNSSPWANLFNNDRWPAFAFNTRWMQK